jgi:hypothetical protein
MNQIAKDFLTRCFAPGETIALLLRNESTAKTQQRIVLLQQALAPRYLGWLAHENHAGANVYVAANPLHSGSRKRTKESIASVRHLYIDICLSRRPRSTAKMKHLTPPPELALLVPVAVGSTPVCFMTCRAISALTHHATKPKLRRTSTVN